jgi:adenylosuccinate lyase
VKPEAAHIFDNRLLGDWYSTKEVRRIFDEGSTLRTWLEVEAALAETQAELDLIPGWTAIAIRDAVSRADFSIERLARETAETAHPLMAVLRELERRAGAAGRYVHWGATTQDILDTAVILQLKQVYEIVTRDLTAIIRRLTDLAEAYRDTMMMGRTHGVHALPITLGFKFSVWIGELLRHQERFDQSATRVLVGQLGGAVGTMAGFGPKAEELRRRLMERLGLNVPTIAWQAARDNLAEFVLLASFLGGSLGKMANEIATLQVTEIAELAEPSSNQKVGSSTMPHKRNPVYSETIVALASLLQGLASPALGSLRTRGERDWTTWGAEMYSVPEAACLLARQLQGMIGVLNGLVVDAERMNRNLEQLSGAQYSEELMLKLVDSLGRDQAHELVTEVAMRALEENEEFRALVDREQKDFRALVVSEPAIAQALDRQQVGEALQPDTNLGEAKTEVDRMVERARSALRARA